MLTVQSSQISKPPSKSINSYRFGLPVLTRGRRILRIFFKFLCRVAVFVCLKSSIKGLENYPLHGPALVVINHLGDPDIILGLAALPDIPEVIGKIELRDHPVLGKFTDRLGVIWIHQGQPDRSALSAALEALHQGRRIIISPEGREAVSGALENGTEGTAFLAIKSGVPIIPVTITGSEFRQIEKNLGKLRRTPVTVTIGKPFFLAYKGRGKDALQVGTRLIMETLARQLPPKYRGVYGYIEE